MSMVSWFHSVSWCQWFHAWFHRFRGVNGFIVSWFRGFIGFMVVSWFHRFRGVNGSIDFAVSRVSFFHRLYGVKGFKGFVVSMVS